MKIVTQDEYKFGQTNIVPFLGTISISSEGIVEVAKEKETLALQLIEAEVGFSLLETPKKDKPEPLKKKSEEDELNTPVKPEEEKSEGNSLQPQIEEDTLNHSSTLNESESTGLTKGEKEALIISLNDKIFQELKQFATEMGFPFEEWDQKRNGKQMLTYLTEKINLL